MGLFSFFKKKKNAVEAPAPVEEKKESAPAAEEKAPEAAPVEEKPAAEAPKAEAPAAPVEEAPKAEEAPAAPVEEAPKAEEAPAAPVEEAPKAEEAPAAPVEEAPKAEKAPAAPAEEAPKAEKKAAPKAPAKNAKAGLPFFAVTQDDIKNAMEAAIAEAEATIAQNNPKSVGKYEFNLEVDGYHFYLVANNGQVLFDSPSFTTLVGCLNGIKTFKKNVAEGAFVIKADKYGRFRFILARKYYGENYGSREQCSKCIESVKHFSVNSRIINYTPNRDDVAAYEAAKLVKRTVDDVDWNQVEADEAAAQKMGKFEICKEDDQFCFYLLANNGQILFASRSFATEAACRKGIESFKRAAYVGNFFVDRDKFGNFRYVLKNLGSAPSFIGESYDNKPQCDKIIESVKKFIVSASIEVEADEATEA